MTFMVYGDYRYTLIYKGPKETYVVAEGYAQDHMAFLMDTMFRMDDVRFANNMHVFRSDHFLVWCKYVYHSGERVSGLTNFKKTRFLNDK